MDFVVLLGALDSFAAYVPHEFWALVLSVSTFLGACSLLVISLKGVTGLLAKLADLTATKVDNDWAANITRWLDAVGAFLDAVRGKVEIVAGHRAPKLGKSK